MATYQFNGARFLSDITNKSSGQNNMMYTMSHLHRGKFQGFAPKNIHVSQWALTAGHHTNMACIDAWKCVTYRVKISDGYFLHHRIGWSLNDIKNKSTVVYDPIALKYKTRLERNMKNVLDQIRIHV